MSVFPGDMSIGWGFGLYPQDELPPLEPQVPDYREPCYVCGTLVDYVEMVDGEVALPKCMYCERVVCSKHINADGYCADSRCQGQESQQTDPLLAVSELKQHVLALQGQVLVEQTRDIEHLLRIQQVDRRITDLEERLRSLVLVVNSLVESIDGEPLTDESILEITPLGKQWLEDQKEKEGETN